MNDPSSPVASTYNTPGLSSLNPITPISSLILFLYFNEKLFCQEIDRWRTVVFHAPNSPVWVALKTALP